MKKHVKALTYKPKIEAVKDGLCIQTIRKGHKVAVGDEILFHGWEGRPYRSKWDWRRRVVVDEIYNLLVDDDTVTFIEDGFSYPWDSTIVDLMATEDFIDPPTGTELKKVLFGLNKTPEEPEEYQIIRWKIKEQGVYLKEIESLK